MLNKMRLSEAKEMRIGVILTYTSMIISYVVAFLITPLIVRKLGQNEYGVYSLMGTFSSYLTLFDMGIGATVVRYVAKYRQEKKETELANFLAVTFLVYLFLASLVLVVSVIIYGQLPQIFGESLTFQEIKECKSIFVFTVLNVIISLLSTVFTAALSGYEFFVVPRIISLVGLVLRIIANIAIVMVSPTAVALTFTTVVFGIISTILTVLYAIRILEIKLCFKNLDFSIFKEILVFSSSVFLQMIISQLYWQIDNTILGILTSTAVVAVYGIGAQINSIVLNVTTSVTSVILPKVTKMVSADEEDDAVTQFMAKISRIILILYAFLTIGFLSLGKEFINLWAGENYTEAFYYAAVVIVCSAIARVESPANDVMKAKFLHRFPVIINFIGAVLNVFISIVLIKQFGIIGSAIGTAIPMILCNTIIYNLYLQKKVGVNLHLYFITIFQGLGKGIIVASVVGFAIHLLPIKSVVFFFIKAVVYMIAYVCTISIWGLNQEEKSLFMSVVKKLYAKCGRER